MHAGAKNNKGAAAPLALQVAMPMHDKVPSFPPP